LLILNIISKCNISWKEISTHFALRAYVYVFFKYKIYTYLYNRKEIIKYVLFFDSFDCHKESVIITGARFWIYKLKATHIKVVKIDQLMPLSSPQRAILTERMFSTRISEIPRGHILS